ncbi:hypothetical protein [Sutcliffiella sp. FSL R7-0096]
MLDITEVLFRSEIKTDFLKMANSLQEDETYNKREAIDDLLVIIEKHNL